jgi:modification methylase
METKHKIIISDSRNMIEVKDKSIQLIITSPPYWQLKDYGNDNQIGFNDTYEEYINNLNLVWNESYRILQDDCRLCVNIGDQFARSVYYGRYKVIPIRTEIIKFCETIGFDYMGAIIWQKVTTCNTTGGASIMGSFPYPRNGILKIDYEFILIFKKPGKKIKVSKEIKKQSKLTTKEWNEYFTGHWHFPGERQNKHLAMFPEELPHRLIKMFSFVGDTILDPFLGSGTTILAAKNLKRNSVGYEINKDFISIIKERTGMANPDLFQNDKFDIIQNNNIEVNYSQAIQKLPYIFKDSVKFNKKVDPRKLNFGSKIDNTKLSPNGRLYSIKSIISPNELLLEKDIPIKLIGIIIDNKKKSEAMEFLNKKLNRNKVYLKFDSEKYDIDNNLICYLYLKNRTFINAHLIKNHLVKVDISTNYKWKNKFLEYFNQTNN